MLEPPPRSVHGTYQLGPDGVALEAPRPETPVVWVDLSVVGGAVVCAPWRPDEQEVSCELAAWAADQLQLNLVRRYTLDRDEVVERWFFRGTVSDMDAPDRSLNGTLFIQTSIDGLELPPREVTYRVRAPRVQVDAEEITAEWAGIAAKDSPFAPPPTGPKAPEERLQVHGAEWGLMPDPPETTKGKTGKKGADQKGADQKAR